MAMNLRLCQGKVPIWVGGDSPYILVNFPDRETFDGLYPRYTKGVSRDKYWAVLMARTNGATFVEVGKKFNITRQAARQIEAKFLRLMRESYWKSRTALEREPLENHRPADGSH
jgi:hypothetical protein